MVIPTLTDCGLLVKKSFSMVLLIAGELGAEEVASSLERFGRDSKQTDVGQVQGAVLKRFTVVGVSAKGEGGC